ncbi:MAG: mycothiol system anti-sigma-R factor [Bifidobacteriaceae bacterium]|jgi:mycothiol system anti-sigma-R factor|nr:mycothiol system anti-sigma-R factor [Bifidobacteriaceae bacterium]
MSHLGDFLCEEVVARVHRFIDDELHGGELIAMLQHLEGCESCSHEADVHIRLKGLVRRACTEAAPDHLRHRISLHIAELSGAVPELA